MIRLDKQLVAATNEFGETQLRPRITATGSRSFFKIKEKEMEKTREFYPMITKTVKTIIELADKKDSAFILYILQNYPNFNNVQISDMRCQKNTRALLDELNRQYARWNKGGIQ